MVFGFPRFFTTANFFKANPPRHLARRAPAGTNVERSNQEL